MTKDEWVASQQALACDHFKPLMTTLADYAEQVARHGGVTITDWQDLKVQVTIQGGSTFPRDKLN